MSVKIIYRPVNPNDKQGYLKIRIIENRKTKIKTLGIKINGCNWLDGKQRVSKAEPKADQINNKIEETLKDLAQFDNPTLAIQTTNKTILEFYDTIIENTTNSGTKSKYKDIKNRFKAYLETIGLNDMKLSQLNTDHVQSFYKFMRVNGCKTNTANYNLKSFKAMINKAISSDLVVYHKNPFALMKLKFEEKKHRALTIDEVQRIIQTEYKDTRAKRYNTLNITLEEIANTFLFQIFAQGMRVSDVQLLKWDNFRVMDNNIFLDYSQFKTKKKITLKLTPIALSMLDIRLKNYDTLFERTLNAIKDRLDELKQTLKEIEVKEMQLKVQKELDERMKHKDIEDYNQRTIERIHNEDQILLERLSVENRIEKTSEDLYTTYALVIAEIKKNGLENDFVFYFFDNDGIMSEYKDGLIMTDKQYKRLQGKRAYYNVLLKEIQKQTSIDTTISSHLARHTYTQLILDSEADLMAVSKALGHSHVSTTQTYISQFPNAKLLDINETLSKSFS